MTRNSFIAGFFGLLGVARSQQSKPYPAGATGTMGPDDTGLTGIIRGGTSLASCKEDSDGIVTCRNTAYEGSQFSVKVHEPYLPKNGQCPVCRHVTYLEIHNPDKHSDHPFKIIVDCSNCHNAFYQYAAD